MLVLSRRLNEKILLPAIDTAVQVVAIKNGVVRLGIEAPPEVAVLREELQQRAPGHGPAGPRPGNRAAPEGLPDGLCRQLCGRLQVTAVGLGTAHLLLDAGRAEDAKEVLGRIQDDLRLLRYGLEGELEAAPRRAARPPRPV